MTRLLLKFALIAAYLACDWRTIEERLLSIGLSPALGIFIAMFLTLTAGLLAAALIRNGTVRILFAVIFCIASAGQQSIEWVTNGPLTYENFINLFHARDNIGSALTQYGQILYRVVPVTLLLFFGIALPPVHLHTRIPAWLPTTAPLIALALLSVLLHQRGGEGSRALPAPFAPLSFAAMMAIENLLADDRPRRDVEIPRSRAPVDRDIILIVDESIAGNYLDINNPAGVATGLDRPPPGIAIFNYGYAASIHTCSATSNLGLRYGGTRDEYRDTIAHQPSIWRYASRAGLRTVFIEARPAVARCKI